jgi:hypothetical protein
MPGPIALPEIYNASTTFIDANLEAGRGVKRLLPLEIMRYRTVMLPR